jgi:RNA polymerase sigma factor (sigma-70 family)
VPLAVLSRDPPVTLATPAESEAAMLERIFRQHGQLVLNTAYRLMGRLSDAEDVLQDVFLALPAALSRYEHRDAFEPWLRRVTVRMSLMHLRRGRSRREIAIESAVRSSVTRSSGRSPRFLTACAPYS